MCVCVVPDPTEHVDLADEPAHKSKVTELLAAFYTYNTQYHPSAPVGSDHDGYCAAAEAHRGFMVPWRANPAAAEGRDGGPPPRQRVSTEGGDPMESMSEREVAAFVAGGGM